MSINPLDFFDTDQVEEDDFFLEDDVFVCEPQPATAVRNSAVIWNENDEGYFGITIDDSMSSNLIPKYFDPQTTLTMMNQVTVDLLCVGYFRQYFSETKIDVKPDDLALILFAMLFHQHCHITFISCPTTMILFRTFTNHLHNLTRKRTMKINIKDHYKDDNNQKNSLKRKKKLKFQCGVIGVPRDVLTTTDFEGVFQTITLASRGNGRDFQFLTNKINLLSDIVGIYLDCVLVLKNNIWSIENAVINVKKTSETSQLKIEQKKYETTAMQVCIENNGENKDDGDGLGYGLDFVNVKGPNKSILTQKPILLDWNDYDYYFGLGFGQMQNNEYANVRSDVSEHDVHFDIELI